MLLLLALLVARPDPPPPPVVRLPAEVVARPGRMVRLAADTAGTRVRWLLPNDDADLVPFPDGRTALFSSPKPGRFLVLAWTAAGDVPGEAARCVVVVTDAPPVPPADELAAELKRLADADRTPGKGEHLAQLAAVYREAVGYAATAEVRTAGELAARIRAAVAALLPADALPGVRQRVADEIARRLPTDGDRPLDAATRRAAGELFARIALALEGLK